MYYEKPSVEIINFIALERIATANDDGFDLDTQPEFNDSVVDWPDD